MTRYEDLPPVDSEGWIADQGRAFLQSTDQRISRLGLPDFFSSTQKKIQGLGSDLGTIYGGLERGLSSLPSAAQQASTDFLTSTQGRISGLGQLGAGLGEGIGGVFSDLGTGLQSSLAAQEAMNRAVRPSEGPPPTAGQEVGPAGFTLPETAALPDTPPPPSPGDLLRRGAGGIRTGVETLLADPDYAENAAALARQRGVLDEAARPLSGITRETPYQDIGRRALETLENVGRSELVGDYGRGATISAVQRLRESGEQLAEQTARTRESAEALGAAQRKGAVGPTPEAAGLLGNATLAALTAVGALPNALTGGAVGGLVGGERNLAEESGLNQWLQQRRLPGVQEDTLVLGGLANPAAAGGVAGQVALPATAADELLGVVLGLGTRAGRPLLERFVREVGPGPVRAALARGPQALGDLYDDFLARTGARAPGGEGGPLGRLLTEERGEAGPLPPSRTPKGPLERLPEPEVPAGAQAIRLTPEEEAGRLRLDKFPEDVRPAIQEAAEAVGFARAQRRGVVPDVEAERLADELAATRSTEQWLAQGKAGRAYNSEELRALANAVHAQARRVEDATGLLTDADTRGEATDALIARVHQEGEKLQALVTLREGGRAETGRAMRAFREATRAVDLPPTDAIARLYTKLGGRENALEAVRQYQALLAEGADPARLARFWARVEQPPPNARDWFRALRYNAMLSGPRTFMINVLGNTAEIPWRFGRDTLASTGRALATGRPEPLRELGAEAAGVVQGLREGVDEAMAVLRHGVSREAAERGDLPRDLSARVRNPAGRALARGLELPSRGLAATDEVFRRAAYRMALGRRAAQAATRSGARGRAWEEAYRQAFENPSTAVSRDALDVADRMTFKGEMGSLGRGLEAFTKQAGPIGDILLPFLRTVYHITARGIDRSPLGALGTGIDVARGVYRPGRELPKGVAPLGERLGDNALGGLAGLGFVLQALQGNVTAAGPEDTRTRQVLRAQGWQPYSVRIGDRWVSYANWGPLAVPLAQAGSLGEAVRYGEADEGLWDLAMDTASRFGRLATEQTYLQSIGDIYRGITEPEQYGEAAVSGFLSSLVPYGSLLNTAGQATDPQMRAPEGVAEALRARLPGARTAVPVARDVFGQERTNPLFGANALNPIRVSPEPPRETAGLRRFAGSPSAEEDLRIARAIDAVRSWQRNPRQQPRPTEDERALAARYAGRENPEYERRIAQGQRLTREARARRAGP